MISDYYSLVSGICILGLGVFVLSRNYRSKLYALFFVMCVSLSIWLLATFMLFTATDDASAIFWDRVVYAGIVFFPTLIFHFVLTFVGKKKPFMVKIGYIVSAIFLIASQTDYFVSGLFRYEWGVHTRAQFLHHFFLLYFFLFVALAFYYLIDFYRKTINDVHKIQSKYIIIAFVFLVGTGTIAYLPAYGIGIYPFAYFSGLIFSVIVAFAIIRYRFLSLQLILKSSLIYGVSLFLSLIVFIYVVYFLQENIFSSFIPSDFGVQIIGLLLFLGFFSFSKKVLRILLDKIWPYKDIDILALFSKIRADLSGQPEIEKRLPIFNQEIVKNFSVQWSALCVKDRKHGTDYLGSWPENIYLTKEQYVSIFRDFPDRGPVVIADELLFRDKKDKYDKLKKWKISALLFIQSENLYDGVVVLGPKTDGADVWFQDKINFLAKLRAKIQDSIAWVMVYDDAMERLKRMTKR